MLSALFSTIGVILGLAVVAIIVAVCLGKGLVDIIAYVVGKIAKAARRNDGK